MGTQADPTDGRNWRAWAHSCIKQRNFNNAEDVYEAGTRHAPDDHMLWHGWVMLALTKLREPGYAHEIVQEGLNKTHAPKERAMILCDQGRVLVELGLRKEAEAAFLEAITLNPRDGHIHYFLSSMVLEPQDRIADACYHYRQALIHTRDYRDRQRLQWALDRLNCNQSW